jgi:tetratricopeptide (TPR) repeat protein
MGSERGHRPGRGRRLALAVFFVSLLAASKLALVSADVVHLKNGRSIRGEVLAEDDDYVTVKVATGSMRLPRRTVLRIEREERTNSLVTQGRELSKLGSHGDAVACLREALSSNDTAPQVKRTLALALVRRAHALLGEGRSVAARMDAREALEHCPDLREALRALDNAQRSARSIDQRRSKARASAVAGRLDVAIGEFESLVKSGRGVDAALISELARLHSSKGLRYFLDSRSTGAPLTRAALESAAKHFDRSLELDPKLLDDFSEPWSLSRVLLGYYRSPVSVAQLRLAATLTRGHPLAACAATLLLEAHGRIKEAQARWTLLAAGSKLTQGRPRDRAVAEAVFATRLESRPKPAPRRVRPSSKAFFEHTSLHFSYSIPTDMRAISVIDAAERAYGEIFPRQQKSLGHLEGKRIRVEIASDLKAYLASGGLPGSEGLTRSERLPNGDIRILIKVYKSPRLLASVLRHEITHALLPIVTQDLKLPRWLHEGLACYHEPELKKRYYERRLVEASGRRQLIPVARLLTLQAYPQGDQVSVFYAESLAVVNELVSRRGLETLVKFSRLLSKMDARVALRRVYQIFDPSELDAMLRRSRSR